MKERIEYFDTAKGILIILVVLGHVFETGPINQYIYSFHMPAFFIIAGIMQHYSSFLEKNLRQAVVSKIYSLIVPFLFFEVLGVLSNIIRFGVTLNFFGYASNTLRLWCNNGPNWFLWALFVDEILFLLLHKLLNNKYVILFLTITIGIFMIINHDIYSTFGSTGVGFLFLTFGYYAAPFFTGKRNKALVFGMWILSIISSALNGKVDLGPWVFGNVLLYIISALAGTIMVIEGSKFISSKLLKFYGRNTLTILGTHQVINLPIRSLKNISAYTASEGMLVFFAIMILEILIIHVANKMIPVLVGKKRKLC